MLNTSHRPIDAYYSLATECVREKEKRDSRKHTPNLHLCVIGIWTRKKSVDFTIAERTPSPRAAELAAAEAAGVRGGANVAKIK